MPRLLRLARWNGYASFAAGCGGILWPILHMSPLGGSTLITSAPKSDRITAALGPAMKLAKSTTFNPENMLSLVMTIPFLLLNTELLTTLELRLTLLKKGGSSFLLVFRSGAKAEEGRLQRQTFGHRRFQAVIDRLKRE